MKINISIFFVEFHLFLFVHLRRYCRASEPCMRTTWYTDLILDSLFDHCVYILCVVCMYDTIHEKCCTVILINYWINEFINGWTLSYIIPRSLWILLISCTSIYERSCVWSHGNGITPLLGTIYMVFYWKLKCVMGLYLWNWIIIIISLISKNRGFPLSRTCDLVFSWYQYKCKCFALCTHTNTNAHSCIPTKRPKTDGSKWKSIHKKFNATKITSHGSRVAGTCLNINQ